MNFKLIDDRGELVSRSVEELIENNTHYNYYGGELEDMGCEVRYLRKLIALLIENSDNPISFVSQNLIPYGYKLATDQDVKNIKLAKKLTGKFKNEKLNDK